MVRRPLEVSYNTATTIIMIMKFTGGDLQTIPRFTAVQLPQLQFYSQTATAGYTTAAALHSDSHCRLHYSCGPPTAAVLQSDSHCRLHYSCGPPTAAAIQSDSHCRLHYSCSAPTAAALQSDSHCRLHYSCAPSTDRQPLTSQPAATSRSRL